MVNTFEYASLRYFKNPITFVKSTKNETSSEDKRLKIPISFLKSIQNETSGKDERFKWLQNAHAFVCINRLSNHCQSIL